MKVLLPVIVLVVTMAFAGIFTQPERFQGMVANFQESASQITQEQSINFSLATPSPTEIPAPTEAPTPTPTITLTPTPTKSPVTPTPKLTVAPNLPSTPAGSGHSKISVSVDSGTYTVDVITADLNSNKVVVDSASASDCRDNCPVMSLGEYASRTGAWAGINGPFFCPSTYPSCVGKTNSFDTLLMNKNKTYFNSDNNVYSTVPAAIFYAGGARFVGRTLEWGRDTGVDSVIANYPMYTAGGKNIFGGSDDSKITSKGARTFIGAKGGTVYIGIVYNASGSDAAKVLEKIGVNESIGLDQGGSTALWLNGRYLAGPGRGLPHGILILRR